MLIHRSITNPPGIPLLILEVALTLLIAAIAMGCRPGPRRPGFFSTLERCLGELARRRALAVLAVGLLSGAMRLLILPLDPIPSPVIQDDFSYLLAGDTFASGRLTNPTHPLWVHFESFHINHLPTYMSMYFPAQGLTLAAGKLLFGHPWFGVLASCMAMSALICWMLQGWLPARWALLGGMLAAMRLGSFSYWIDTYTGGAVAAAAGALVLGAYPRIRRHSRVRDYVWMAIGMAILANSRPYEGLLLCVPVVISLALWLFKTRPDASVLAWRIAPAAAILLATGVFMGYYNHRVFGSVFTPPYSVNRAMYASAPHFLWQKQKPEPVYRHKALRDFYTGEELRSFLESKTLPGFLKMCGIKVILCVLFFLGFSLLIFFVMLPWVFRDRRIRFLLILGGVFAVGLGVETWLLPHYVAPYTAALYAILLQCMRHLRVWRPGGRPSGLFLVRAMTVACAGLFLLRAFAQPLHIALAPEQAPTQAWYGTKPLGLERAHVLAQLESLPGSQLAVVRYAPNHDPLFEWVYNAADIDHASVVWAREMNPAKDRELIQYFKNRRIWLVEPDSRPPRISPYPVAQPAGTDDQIAASLSLPRR